MYINGRNAVVEALRSGQDVEKVYLMYGLEGEPLRRIRREAKEAGVPCVTIDKARFVAMEREAGVSGRSQGVMALMSPLEYVDLEALVDQILQQGRQPLVAVMDGLTDPHNVGAIIRSAECAGIDAVLLGREDTGSITDTVVKASSGAVSHLPIARVSHVIDILIGLRQMGLELVGLDESGDVEYTEVGYAGPMAILIGSEGRGLQPKLRRMCDRLVSIPMQGQVQSLNASVAAAVVFFEALRQRRVESTTRAARAGGIDDSLTHG